MNSHDLHANEVEKVFQEIKGILNRFGGFKETAKKQLRATWEPRFIKKNCPVCLKKFNDLYAPNKQQEIEEPFK